MHDYHVDDATDNKCVNPAKPSHTTRMACLPDPASIIDKDSGGITNSAPRVIREDCILPRST